MKKAINWMYSKDNPNHKYNKKNNSSKKETLKSFLKQNAFKATYAPKITSKDTEIIWSNFISPACRHFI